MLRAEPPAITTDSPDRLSPDEHQQEFQELPPWAQEKQTGSSIQRDADKDWSERSNSSSAFKNSDEQGSSLARSERDWSEKSGSHLLKDDF